MPPDFDDLSNANEPASGSTPETPEAVAARLLELMRELLAEIRPSAATTTLALDSHVERDLALDSLARTELLQRVERVFHVRLDERVLLAETPRDLVELILRASGESSGPALAVDWRAPTAEPATVVEAPERAATLLDVLDWHAEARPEQVAIQIYGPDDQIDATFTYAGLREGARAVAAGLRDRGLQPGQTVAIMLPTGGEYSLRCFGIPPAARPWPEGRPRAANFPAVHPTPCGRAAGGRRPTRRCGPRRSRNTCAVTPASWATPKPWR